MSINKPQTLTLAVRNEDKITSPFLTNHSLWRH